jgi:hypothetical protein
MTVTVPAADGTEPGVGTPDYAAWQRDFHGLLVLGQLSNTFEWAGHRFVIKTLNTSDELIVALLTKEFQDTIGGTRAYATAMVALCTVAVDGMPLPSPLGEDPLPGGSLNWARERFAYCQRWYHYTVDAIYNEYLTLEARVTEVVLQMGKESPPGTGSPGNASSPSEEASSADSGSPSSRKQPSSSASSSKAPTAKTTGGSRQRQPSSPSGSSTPR